MEMAVDVVVPGHANDPVKFAADELGHPGQKSRCLFVVRLCSSGANIADDQYRIARSGPSDEAAQLDQQPPSDLGVKVKTVAFGAWIVQVYV